MGRATALRTGQRPHGPVVIVHAQRHPVIVAETELGRAPAQMLLRAVLAASLEAALEQAEEAFDVPALIV
jgi:hypothetical protein